MIPMDDVATRARFACGMAKVFAPVACIGFVVATRSGLAHPMILLLAVIFGFLWLGFQLWGWRRRNEWLSGAGLLVILLGPHFAGKDSWSEPVQWQFYGLTFIIAFVPMIFLRRSIIRWCRLEEESVRPDK